MNKVTDVDVSSLAHYHVTPSPKETLVRVYAAENFSLTVNKTDALTGASSLIMAVPSSGHEVLMRLTNLGGCNYAHEILIYGNTSNSLQAVKVHFVGNMGDLEIIPNTDVAVEVYE